MDYITLGWSHDWDHELERAPIEAFARITAKHRTSYTALDSSGNVLNLYLTGRMLYESEDSADLPAVGDWCSIRTKFIDESNTQAGLIGDVLPRRSKLSRFAAGVETSEQILAANIDFVFVVSSINRDMNVNRLKRFIVLAESGRAQPVIILSKMDLLDDDTSADIDELESALDGIPIIKISAHAEMGIELIRTYLGPGKTAVFVGSSGVGKSTLVNCILNEKRQVVREIRQSEKGKHTTSSSSLFFTSEGGVIIDTPGLREVQIFAEEESLDAILPEVIALSRACRFSDCTHESEPGCAVIDAIDGGLIDDAELENYKKLEREIAYGKRRMDQRLAQAERKKWKQISVQNRQRRKYAME